MRQKTLHNVEFSFFWFARDYEEMANLREIKIYYHRDGTFVASDKNATLKRFSRREPCGGHLLDFHQRLEFTKWLMNLICWAMDFQGRIVSFRNEFSHHVLATLKLARTAQINRRCARRSSVSCCAIAVTEDEKRLRWNHMMSSIHRADWRWMKDKCGHSQRDINHLRIPLLLLLTMMMMLSLTQPQPFYGNLLSRTIKRISFVGLAQLNFFFFSVGRRHQQMWFTFMISARRVLLNWFTKKRISSDMWARRICPHARIFCVFLLICA